MDDYGYNPTYDLWDPFEEYEMVECEDCGGEVYDPFGEDKTLCVYCEWLSVYEEDEQEYDETIAESVAA